MERTVKIEDAPQQMAGAKQLKRRAISAPTVLNEAYEYPRPSSFSRGLRIDLNDLTILLISGTASIDESGQTVHAGDFRAQLGRTYTNITGLLTAEGADMEGRSAHNLLSVRYRPELRCIQRGAHGIFRAAGTRSAARLYRDTGHAVPPRGAGGN